MSNVRHGFETNVVDIALERIIADSQLTKGALATSKYRTILSSIAELGVIEPLAVFRSPRRLGDYELLDGRLRLEALKELRRETAPCMISTDDESFTFNRHITRLSAVQEHKMIRAALAKGASEKRIAEVLRMDVRSIRMRATLLDGLAPEAVSLLKNRQAAPKVFSVLKKMKPFRQIEAAEIMAAANKFTATYAEMILVATRCDALVDGAKPKKKDEISTEDLAKMEGEMERLRQDCQAVEDEIGDTMLSLVVAKSFMVRLLRNENIQGHLKRHHGDLLTSLVTTMDAIAADNRITQRE
ncbi:ParB-like nuclease family protein [Paraburkholderia sp. GV068]|uniref:ParB/RepB/Spo0J family partition protein n=1 Tax=unclassified Paraburkholderia TaxID=2615204 RepID=UPI000D309853|nr:MULTISPECIES: plasmid partitioning protein RepB C-terminal domain-containing protein [unclassified Paraburkholderia]PTR03807.1 ParB-like nuclease family protein [Paraburkholderia sp. GV072]PUB08765.1 ParB-like nuclease family protein [Paraburkholderia sp. GV068]